MSRRPFSADGALASVRQPAWSAGWRLAWPVRGGAYLLNTLAVAIMAGALLWLQPSLLSAPYDGVFTYLNVVQTSQWQPAGQWLGGYQPLEGMGARLMPSVPVLLPHTSAVWLTSDPGTRVWLVYLTLAIMLALGVLAYYRAAGVGRRTAIAATWLALVLALTLSDLARATWGVIYGQVGLVVALAAFLQVGVGSTRRSAGWALGFGLVVVGFLLSDHVFSGYVAGPVLGFALLATTIAAPTWTERWWKLGALLGAGMVVVALGIPQWMLALTASISRTVFFDELIAQPQHAYTAGVLFRPTDAFTLVGVLAILGIVGDLAWGDRRQRALAAISGLLTLGLVAAGVIWLTTDFKWRGPAPAFFSVMTFPWLALSAVRGLDYAMSWRPTCVTGRYWLPLALAAVLGVCFAGSILWVLANRESLVSRFLRSGVMRDLGFLSFGIYMWHVIVKVLVFYRFQTVELSRFPTDARFVLMFSYYVLGSLAIATVTYFFVERPFLRLKDHFITSASIRHSKPKRTSRINWRFWGWYCLLPAVGVVIVETILRLR